MEKSIKEFQRLFAAENDFIIQEATRRVSNSIVRLNPVDEGDSVAEWDAMVGRWPADTKQQPDPKKTRTRKRLADMFRDVKFGQAVFFENTDPIAARLEFGYSKQAPQGIVRLTARRWRQFVRGAATAARNRVRKKLETE